MWLEKGKTVKFDLLVVEKFKLHVALQTRSRIKINFRVIKNRQLPFRYFIDKGNGAINGTMRKNIKGSVKVH